MSERPILFSAPMVRAILAGTKTQTRRPVKWRGLQPGLNLQFSGLFASRIVETWVLESPSRTSSEWRCQPTRCPYGQPGSGDRVGGDRLYVRETWAAPHAYDHLPPRLIPLDARIHYAATECRGGLLWRPSIHMPRWASRITLEITGVRVERLQDISYEDAISEGVMNPAEVPAFPERIGGGETVEQYAKRTRYPQRSYAALWDEINGPGSWDANPWVWVVEFRRLP